MVQKSKDLCHGCRDDFYNQGNNSTTGECWCFKNAEVVTRYRIGWWISPIQPGAFVEVETLSCHHAPGKFEYREKLPDHAVKPVLLSAE